MTDFRFITKPGDQPKAIENGRLALQQDDSLHSISLKRAEKIVRTNQAKFQINMGQTVIPAAPVENTRAPSFNNYVQAAITGTPLPAAQGQDQLYTAGQGPRQAAAGPVFFERTPADFDRSPNNGIYRAQYQPDPAFRKEKEQIVDRANRHQGHNHGHNRYNGEYGPGPGRGYGPGPGFNGYNDFHDGPIGKN